MIPFKGKDYRCAMEITMAILGGKWKVLLIWHLGNQGALRFNALGRLHPQLTPKMLAQQLKEMEHDGLIVRRSFDQIPPRVEYSLTAAGQSLMPILGQMCAWGETYVTGQPCASRLAGPVPSPASCGAATA